VPALRPSGARLLVRDIVKDKWLYIFVLPGIVWFFIFCYVPMYGVVTAFQDFKISKGIWGSRWVGFDNFIRFFTSISFGRIMTNTLSISLLNLAICFPAPIIMALLVNELRNKSFKRTVQTISYMPFFMSWTVVAAIWFELLSVDRGGTVNMLLMNLGLIKEPIFFFGASKYFYSIIVLSNLWKGVGFGMIIYLAAIAAVNTELYEAAAIDGCGRLRQVWHIILPAIKPTILVLFILTVPGILNAGFEQIYAMQNNMVKDVSLVIDTYVLEIGIRNARYGLAASIGLFKSLVGLIMLLTTNFIIKKFGEDGII